MKKSAIISFLVLFGMSLYSQNLFYTIRSNKSHSIKKETVVAAQKMGDIIPYYPADWILKYLSVELIYGKEGKIITLKSKNEELSAEQKNVLKNAEIGDDITINIQYLSKNAINDKEEVSKMHYETLIVPEVEAEFETVGKENAQHDKKDGRTSEYIKNNIVSKIPDATQKQLKQTLIRFTVSENGQVTSPKVYRSSGDKNIDNLMLEAIRKMPEWKPAQTADGTKVKQQFEFSIGTEGGC